MTPTADERLDLAIAHHQAGRLQQAEEGYRQILQLDPRHADALHLLGMVLHQLGSHEPAIEMMNRALALQPETIVFYTNLGAVYHATGKLEEAVASYRRALHINPDQAEVHRDLGIALRNQGKLEDAVASYERALEIEPNSAQVYENLGVVLRDLGRLEEAVSCLQRAVEIKPDFAEAHNILGVTFMDIGRTDQAIACIQRALQIEPSSAEACNALGAAYARQEEYGKAVAAYERALQIKPDFVAAHNNLGMAWEQQGMLDDAVQWYERALEIDPDCVETHNNLGMLRREQGRLGEAMASFQRAVQINPECAVAHDNMGAAYRDQGKMDEAISCHQRALQIKPDFAEAYVNLGRRFEEQGKLDDARLHYSRAIENNVDQPLLELRVAMLLPTVFQSKSEMDQCRGKLLSDINRFSNEKLRPNLAKLTSSQGEAPFNLQFHDVDIRPIKEAYATIYRKYFPAETARICSNRNRIGFVVTNRHERVFLKSMKGVLQHMNADSWELTVVCSRAGDARLRPQLENRSVRTMIVPDRFDRTVEAIKRAEFDILYYWEVGTDATNYFLPFFRLAPVQCTSWGVQVTSGITQMDYYLSSDLVEPDDAQSHYSEELILAKSLLSYQYRVDLPDSPKSREDFGFTAQQHLYACPQHIGKFHPDFDPVLAEILRRDSRGVIVITQDRYGYHAETLRQRLARTLPGFADRVTFLPQLTNRDYLSLIAAADVLLDPLYFGGVNTTYDGFSLGKPIVTMPSRFHRGRYTYGCYRKMGVMDCVAADVDDYVNIAVRLGTDADYRASMAARIRESSHLLFEDAEAVGEHERIFQQLLARARPE